ncbi:hypothetical protein PCE1_000717 [Barthelona sp. PCE]
MFGAPGLFVEKAFNSSLIIVEKENVDPYPSPNFVRKIKRKAPNDCFKRVMCDNSLYYTFIGRSIEFMSITDDGWEIEKTIHVNLQQLSDIMQLEIDVWEFYTLICVSPTVFLMCYHHRFNDFKISLIDIESLEVYAFKEFNYKIFRQCYSTSCSGMLLLENRSHNEYFMLTFKQGDFSITDGPSLEENCISLHNYFPSSFDGIISVVPFINIDYCCMVLSHDGLTTGMLLIGQGEVIDIANIFDCVVGQKQAYDITAQIHCFTDQRIHFVLHRANNSVHIVKDRNECNYFEVNHHTTLNNYTLCKTTTNVVLSEFDFVEKDWVEIISYKTKKMPLVFQMNSRSVITTIDVGTFKRFTNEKLLMFSKKCAMCLDFKNNVTHIIPNQALSDSSEPTQIYHCFVDDDHILSWNGKNGFNSTCLTDFSTEIIDVEDNPSSFFPSDTPNSSKCLFVEEENLMGSTVLINYKLDAVLSDAESPNLISFNQFFLASYVNDAVVVQHKHGIIFKCLKTETIVSSDFYCDGVRFVVVNPYNTSIFVIITLTEIFLFEVDFNNNSIIKASETDFNYDGKHFMASWISPTKILLLNHGKVKTFDITTCQLSILELEDVKNPETYTFFNNSDSTMTAFKHIEDENVLERIDIDCDGQSFDIISRKTIPLIDLLCSSTVNIKGK